MNNKWLVRPVKSKSFVYSEYKYLIFYFFITNLYFFFNNFFFQRIRNFFTLIRFFELKHSSLSRPAENKLHSLFRQLKAPRVHAVPFKSLTRNIKFKLFSLMKCKFLYFENVLFLFNLFFNKNHFTPHHNFDLFAIKTFKNSFVIFNVKKFFKRWNDGITFLLNLFYYNLKPLMFGNLFFKKETLALNWNYNLFNIFLWRFYSAFFTDKKIQFDSFSNYFFLQIKKFNLRFCLVSDVNNHFKNFFFFKRNFFFTIGLINVFINPWLVDYPFFLYSDNYVGQLFFFKLVFFLQKKSIYWRFTMLKVNYASFKLS